MTNIKFHLVRMKPRLQNYIRNHIALEPMATENTTISSLVDINNDTFASYTLKKYKSN